MSFHYISDAITASITFIATANALADANVLAATAAEPTAEYAHVLTTTFVSDEPATNANVLAAAGSDDELSTSTSNAYVLASAIAIAAV